MGTRQTKKAGIYKPRKVSDPEVMKAINAIIERLEVLDGLRGDNLDQAVTWRDLGNTGFILGTGAGGAPTITNTPGPGTGDGGTPIPGIGPAGPPSNLAATETFLALLLTWDNTDFNLQHVEVWRCDVDNLSLALDENYANGGMIGTTVSPQFIDYVGASASFYYWVRSVGTDGTYSAFNDTAGTLGTTGIDPGNLTIDPRFFTLEDGTGTELPFLTDGQGDIGIAGNLIVKESIRATSIVGKTIGADQLVGNNLAALYAELGTVTSGLFRTDQSPAFRVEVGDQASTVYPIWYGSGAKTADNGLFYCDRNGNVYIKGLLDTTILKGTLFTPANPSAGYDPFRIATQFSGAVQPADSYSGKEAHLLPMKSSNLTTATTVAWAAGTSTKFETDGYPWYWIGNGLTHAGNSFYRSSYIRFFGPQYSGSVKYGRLGTYNEMIMAVFGATARQFVGVGGLPYGAAKLELTLEYRYDGSGTWSRVTSIPFYIDNTGSTSFSQAISTRSSSWTTFDLRVVLGVLTFYAGYDPSTPESPDLRNTIVITSASLSAFCPNYGVSDTAAATTTGTAETPIEDLATDSAAIGGGVMNIIQLN